MLSSIFRESIEDGFDARLNILLESLVSTAELTDGELSLRRPLAEPRFDQAYSGWYWQIDGQPDVQLRSRSLFDQTLQANDQLGATVGPNGEALRLLAREFVLPGTSTPFTFTIAADTEELDDQVRRFRTVLVWSLGLLAFGLTIAVIIQVHFGLRPLGHIGATLARIRGGKTARLDGPFPREVMPLANEVNELLAHSETIVERSRTHVGNLAHALKTPIAVLANEAGTRDDKLSETVRVQTDLMRRQVDHYLSRARAAATGALLTARTNVRPVISSLARTLRRMYDEKDLTIVETCPATLAFRG